MAFRRSAGHWTTGTSSVIRLFVNLMDEQDGTFPGRLVVASNAPGTSEVTLAARVPHRCLSVDPDARPHTMLDVANALRAMGPHTRPEPQVEVTAERSATTFTSTTSQTRWRTWSRLRCRRR